MAATINDLAAVDETVADGDFLAMHNVSKTAGTKDQKLSITKLRGDAFLGRANAWTAAQTVQSPAAGTVPVVVQGAASQTAALQEWRNSSGATLASITANGGIRSQSVSVADDTAITLYDSVIHGMLLLWVTGAAAEVGNTLLAIRAGVTSPYATILAGGRLLETTTSNVTGTTGTDGRLTVAATTTALKIENRLGGTRTVNWLRIG